MFKKFQKSSIFYATNAYRKCKNENFKKQKNMFVSYVPRIAQPKLDS